MPKTAKTLIMLTPLICSLPSCSNNGNVPTIELRSQNVVNYLKASNENDICHALMDATYRDENQIGSISIDDNSHFEYEFQFSKNEDFSDYFSIRSYGSTVNPSCLQGGSTYYYRVYGDRKNDEVIGSGKFNTVDSPGIFYNIDGLVNVRDIGGWDTSFGRRVKRGMIIRGGKTNQSDDIPSYSDEGYSLLTEALKINGEIDLRSESDNYGQTHNFISIDKPYISAPFTTCNYILPSFNQEEPVKRSFDGRTPSSFKKIFSFLADESNYPIYIHCNAGADRTGTICLLMEAVLGVPLHQLYMDVELTSFSRVGGRYRSQVKGSYSEELYFDQSGVMQDDKDNYVAFAKCVKDLWDEYGNGLTFRAAVVNYLKTVCGVTDEEMASFIKIMLG